MATPPTGEDGKSFWCEAPPGWKKRVTYRSTTVNNKSKADVYFYAPSESVHTTRFRSEKKLREYLYKNMGVTPNLPPPEAFDWSYPGGTRDGKCKEGGPLTNKAAPDMPRQPLLKTTGKRDPRKRPRESPSKGAPPEGDAEVKRDAANIKEGKVSENGELDSEGPKPKKKKGRPSAPGKAAAKDESTSELVDNITPRDAPELAGQVPATEGTPESNPTTKPAALKRKGRPPRIKGAGKTAAAESVGVLMKAKEKAPATEEVTISMQVAAASIEPQSALALPAPIGPASQEQRAEETDTREGMNQAETQEEPDTQDKRDTVQQQGVLVEQGAEEIPLVRGAESAEQIPARREAEGLPNAAAPADNSKEDEPEVKDDGRDDVSKEADDVKEPDGSAEQCVSLARETQQQVFTVQAPEKMQVKLESIGDDAEAQAPEGVEQSAFPEKDNEDATGTPMSILDAENRPCDMDVDDEGLSKETAADAPAEEGKMNAPAEGENVDASTEGNKMDTLTDGERVTGSDEGEGINASTEGNTKGSLELARAAENGPPKAETSPCNEAAPSSSQLNSELKAMRKKARLAKALGPHEPVARPRREKPSPLVDFPADVAPQGIADVVKLRTAGTQAEKKNARQQGGERVYASRLPPGFSVSAAIAAAAKASPPLKNRGRPPKGASRLSKQAEEETEEERRERERREEHEAAVRIFKEEEDERDRVLKERGCFYPPDESLADRPKPAPLNGKRCTKSALVAEHLERTKRMKVEDSEMEDLSDELDGTGDESREALLHRKRMDMRARRRAERDQRESGRDLPRIIREDGKKRDGRKKRKGWTAVRTQKRTSMVCAARFRRDGGEAEPSRRSGQHPLDVDPDPTYDSDANSSELKMGQKLDEHGFFERDDFEVASREHTGRKPPRERLPLAGAPQRRRSFGHRKGHPGLANAKSERLLAEQSERSNGGEVVKDEGRDGGQEEREPKKRMLIGAAWQLGAASLHSSGPELTTGGTEAFRSDKHLGAAPPLTSC